jgi:hypothetical protein
MSRPAVVAATPVGVDNVHVIHRNHHVRHLLAARNVLRELPNRATPTTRSGPCSPFMFDPPRRRDRPGCLWLSAGCDVTRLLEDARIRVTTRSSTEAPVHPDFTRMPKGGSSVSAASSQSARSTHPGTRNRTADRLLIRRGARCSPLRTPSMGVARTYCSGRMEFIN